MDIVTIIFTVVACVIVGCIAYYIGTKKTSNIEQINNDQLKQEREYLIQENHRITKEFKQKQDAILQSQETIKQADELKNSMLKNAEDAYDERVQKLNEEYNNRRKIFEQDLKKQEDEYKIRIDKFRTEENSIKQKMDKIKKSYKSAVETSKRTAAIQEDKNNYRLVINAADANDIKTIESIRHLLIKPRILSMLIWQTYYQPLAKQKFPVILGQNKVTGIYKITNTETQECYIGQAVDVRDRWNQHCKCGLGIDTPEKNKLYQAMREYGLENFTFELLEECDTSELNNREKYYIDMFNSVDYGYNGNAGQNG